MQFSKEQNAIFEYFEMGNGNSVFRARAGTGKTTTLVHGFKHAPESRILYAVFNKRNQLEAAEKISDPRVTVKTLHSLGFDFCRKQWGGLRADGFTEWNRAETVSPGLPNQVKAVVASLVSRVKNEFIHPTAEDIEQTRQLIGAECFGDFASWNGQIAELASKVIELSRAGKPKDGKISFDDMIWLPVALNWVKPCFDLAAIDEAQDMNLPQLTLATQASANRLALVGDDRQAIYGFRGAMQNGIDTFKTKLNASELGLTVTYRCPKRIVALAKNIVPDYSAHESAIDGEVTSTTSEKLTSQVSIGDAILSRNNAPLMRHALRLLREGKTARIEGKDLARDLSRIIKGLEAHDVPSFIDKLETWEQTQIARAKGRTAAQRIETVSDQKETLKAIAEVATDVPDIERRLNSLFEDTENAKRPAVVLSTVHKAKGLEWKNVFLLSHTFKGGRKDSTPEELRQEENVYYVALTRAKEKLTMVSEK